MGRGRNQPGRRSPTSVIGPGVVIVGVLAALGCTRRYCVEGLDLGTTYRVSVLEPADDSSQYGVRTSYGPDFGVSVDPTLTCGAGFDFVSGSAFLIEPISKADLSNCDGRIAVPSEVTEIQLVRQTDRQVGGGVLMATPMFQVDRGAGCTGNWQLYFLHTPPNPPLTAPVPGERPSVLLERRFYGPLVPGVQSCFLLPDSNLEKRSYCIDYFVVGLDKA